MCYKSDIKIIVPVIAKRINNMDLRLETPKTLDVIENSIEFPSTIDKSEMMVAKWRNLAYSAFVDVFECPPPYPVDCVDSEFPNGKCHVKMSHSKSTFEAYESCVDANIDRSRANEAFTNFILHYENTVAEEFKESCGSRIPVLFDDSYVYALESWLRYINSTEDFTENFHTIMWLFRHMYICDARLMPNDSRIKVGNKRYYKFNKAVLEEELL